MSDNKNNGMIFSKTNRFCLIGTVFCLFLYSSCTPGSQVKLVGKWANKDGNDTIEFFKDGTVCVREKDVEVCGNYRFVDDDRIRVRFGNMGEIEIFNIFISDNELTIFFSNGEYGTYRIA